jgi:hypothetical protein
MPRNCRAPAEADREDYLDPDDLTIGRASEHLSHLSRDRWFESISSSEEFAKLSVPKHQAINPAQQLAQATFAATFFVCG